MGLSLLLDDLNFDCIESKTQHNMTVYPAIFLVNSRIKKISIENTEMVILKTIYDVYVNMYITYVIAVVFLFISQRLANASDESQRMHIIPPSTKFFYIKYTKKVILQ